MPRQPDFPDYTADERQSLSPEQARLLPFYHDLRNEIVEPDRVVVTTQYFWTRWAPLLGPTLTALIVTLRRHCYYNKITKERRDWCFPEQATLAREIGVDSTKTIRAALAHPFASYFVRRQPRYVYDPALGKKVRTSDLYFVAMDDPLTPEDEQLLCLRAAQRLIAEGRAAEITSRPVSPPTAPTDDGRSHGASNDDNAPSLAVDAAPATTSRPSGELRVSPNIPNSWSGSEAATPMRSADAAPERPIGKKRRQVTAPGGKNRPQHSAVNSSPEDVLLTSTLYTTNVSSTSSSTSVDNSAREAAQAVSDWHSLDSSFLSRAGSDVAHRTALASYAAANDRRPSPAEVEQLAALADRYDEVARRQGSTGWAWLADAIDDAVAAGSAFVAPRRIDRILRRWATEGRHDHGAPREVLERSPEARAAKPTRGEGRRGRSATSATRRSRVGDDASADALMAEEALPGEARPVARQTAESDLEEPALPPASAGAPPRRPQFVVDPATGLTNGQCWALVLDDLSRVVAPAAFLAWLRPTVLLAREDGGEGGPLRLVVGAPSSGHAAWLEGHYRSEVELAVKRVLGIAARVAVRFVAEPSWRDGEGHERGAG